MKITIIFAVIILSCSSVFANHTVFTIERNKNANVVYYDANITDKKIDEKNPIDAYWLLHAIDGRREELSAFEKKAYGFKTKHTNEKHFELALKAVEDRAIKLFTHNGLAVAEITINNKKAYLKKVYVFSKDGMLGIPKVYYYILHGIDPETGQEVSEKIELKKDK
ncbi:DUF4833 domain-containing protein [Endomicrobium proavitum]|uniref:DUF4833 domain-containing protein n=1 Tax=Endomicrobium proavitum TaxID=1408281 RepID=A0A0G3WK33_9BACT|nr:DUF4833 domain-containing protein [Endomicrobium proavitum]AKL98255.1 exported protein of unknown function [Endomicrobium proavitum]